MRRRRIPEAAWLVFALAAPASPAPAWAQARDAVYLRAGVVSEGPQHTFEKGLELGAGWERHTDLGFARGLGISFVRQADSEGFDEFEATMLSVEGHVRWAIDRARLRPLVEMGLGGYRFDWHSRWQPGEPAYEGDWIAPGGWLGLGAAVRLTAAVDARLGIAWHFIAQGIATDGGNMEDYFATGLTLEFALPRR